MVKVKDITNISPGKPPLCPICGSILLGVARFGTSVSTSRYECPQILQHANQCSIELVYDHYNKLILITLSPSESFYVFEINLKSQDIILYYFVGKGLYDGISLADKGFSNIEDFEIRDLKKEDCDMYLTFS